MNPYISLARISYLSHDRGDVDDATSLLPHHRTDEGRLHI